MGTSGSAEAPEGLGTGPGGWASRLVPAWILPNHLTCLRMAGSLVILGLGLGGAHLGWIVGVGLASGLSDNLDGVLARQRGQVTKLGALLDPLADKLFAAVLMVVLWWRGLADGRLLILAAAMDLHALVIPLLVLLDRRRRGQPLRPLPRVQTNRWGKLKTAVLAWAMGFVILGATLDLTWLGTFGTYSIWGAVGLGLVAMYRYFEAYRAGDFA